MTETTAQAAGTDTQTISSSISIQPIAEFNPDTEIGASLATRWTTWLNDFEMFLLASGIQETKRQRALLLYQAGSRVREIFRQLNDTGEDDDYERAKTKLTEYFEDQTDGSLAPIQPTRHCYYCGGSYPHQGVCPAKGKSCRKCSKQNHFSKVCRGKYEREPPKRDNTKRHSKKPGKRPINPLKPNESDQSDSNTEGEDYLYNVRNKKPPQVRVTVCKSSFKATIDTGATIDVIDKSMDGVHLKKTNIKAFAYMSDKPVRCKAAAVIPKFDKMFATHGIPDTLKTDNGPPFNREEYRRYMETLRIKVIYSTPYWPQGNGEAERFMQPLGKALKTAHAERRPWRQELN